LQLHGLQLYAALLVAMQPASASDPVNFATEHVIDEHPGEDNAVHVQVEQSDGMWWTLPKDASEQVLKRCRDGENDAGYEWDWAQEGEESFLIAYGIDFRTMTQGDVRREDRSAVRFVRFLAGTSVRTAARTGALRLQVAFPNEKWWDLPHSADLLEKYLDDWAEVSCVWDWHGARDGSYTDPEGETTPYSRYIIDFRRMIQRNTDNNRTRALCFVHIVAVP
jgi:hypothetical protein